MFLGCFDTTWVEQERELFYGAPGGRVPERDRCKIGLKPMAKGQAREAKVKVSARSYRDAALCPHPEPNHIWHNVASDDFCSAPVSVDYSGATEDESYHKEAGRREAEDGGERSDGIGQKHRVARYTIEDDQGEEQVELSERRRALSTDGCQ